MRPGGNRRGISAASDLFCTLNKLLTASLKRLVASAVTRVRTARHYSLPFRESSIKDCMDTHSA